MQHIDEDSRSLFQLSNSLALHSSIIEFLQNSFSVISKESSTEKSLKNMRFLPSVEMTLT
ncbi:MAG: hypothetical protein AUK34_06370 [Ignavibacteria bacterium CG2_30_36_16]|nr:MAG: hypothetical protein AUK34_06370 [Ignavibacteria bacterium CG2_30_36_16]